MRKLKASVLEEHPLTNSFIVMFNEMAEYCREVLEIKEKLDRTDRASEEFYSLMARLDTLLMGIGLTARHLRAESDRMDEMFDHEW
jgi:predicted nuclease with TOPRIM domain